MKKSRLSLNTLPSQLVLLLSSTRCSSVNVSLDKLLIRFSSSHVWGKCTCSPASVLLHLLIIAGSFALWMMSHRVLVVGPCPDPVDMTDKTVIVTGANAGIGFEIAKLLADMGAH